MRAAAPAPAPAKPKGKCAINAPFLLSSFGVVPLAGGAPQRQAGVKVMYGSVAPGMLYDATRDQVMVDKFLWPKATIALRTTDITSSRSDWSVQHTLSDRTSALDISADMKLSFMAGLVKVSSAPSYCALRRLAITLQFSLRSKVRPSICRKRRCAKTPPRSSTPINSSIPQRPWTARSPK